MLSSKIFPFCPGISWQTYNGKYIIPKIPSYAWERAVLNRNPVIVSFGGLLEAFFSLSLLEALNYLKPHLKLSWGGEERFKPLLQINGLARYFPLIKKEQLQKFPLPLFMDKEKYIFFNCLNDYLIKKSYYNLDTCKDYYPALQQIFNNALIPWDQKYLPQIRNNTCSSELEQWMKFNRFYINKPFVMIFPDLTGFSMHSEYYLDWHATQVKALASILSSKGISLLIFSNFSSRYFGGQGYLLAPKIEDIFYFLPQATAILSREVDFSLIAMMFSPQIKIIASPLLRQFNLKKNNKFIWGTNNLIYTLIEPSPMMVANIIQA